MIKIHKDKQMAGASIHLYLSTMVQACQPVQQDAPWHPEKHNCTFQFKLIFFLLSVKNKLLQFKNMRSIKQEATTTKNHKGKRKKYSLPHLEQHKF